MKMATHSSSMDSSSSSTTTTDEESAEATRTITTLPIAYTETANRITPPLVIKDEKPEEKGGSKEKNQDPQQQQQHCSGGNESSNHRNLSNIHSHNNGKHKNPLITPPSTPPSRQRKSSSSHRVQFNSRLRIISFPSRWTTAPTTSPSTCPSGHPPHEQQLKSSTIGPQMVEQKRNCWYLESDLAQFRDEARTTCRQMRFAKHVQQQQSQAQAHHQPGQPTPSVPQTQEQEPQHDLRQDPPPNRYSQQQEQQYQEPPDHLFKGRCLMAYDSETRGLEGRICMERQRRKYLANQVVLRLQQQQSQPQSPQQLSAFPSPSTAGTTKSSNTQFHHTYGDQEESNSEQHPSTTPTATTTTSSSSSSSTTTIPRMARGPEHLAVLYLRCTKWAAQLAQQEGLRDYHRAYDSPKNKDSRAPCQQHNRLKRDWNSCQQHPHSQEPCGGHGLSAHVSTKNNQEQSPSLPTSNASAAEEQCGSQVSNTNHPSEDLMFPDRCVRQRIT